MKANLTPTPWYIKEYDNDNLVCLPPSFFDDHCERDLPTPKVVAPRGVSYWVSIKDPALTELLSDAEHYAHRDGPDGISSDLKKSAVTTRNRIRVALKVSS